MKAVVVGAVGSTRTAIRALTKSPLWTVSAVVTLPATLAARHSDFVDLSADAKEAGAQLLAASNSNAPNVIAALSALQADYAFVIGWSQICTPEFRSIFSGNVVGYHPAALPRLRGRAVIPWTILLDEKITGSTLFMIDDGVDSGPIIAQKFFHVAPAETATTLYGRHMEALGEILDNSLAPLAEGRAMVLPQDDLYATHAARRTEADGLIDWRLPASAVERLIRAVTRPYPGAFTYVGPEKLTIWAAEIWADSRRYASRAGQVIERHGDALAIACGDGAILATDWDCAKRDIRNHVVLDGGSL
ncbi:MAG: formyltransferase family protein [Parvularculaceae bacterium]|nr:formyltransferase family protein [Parvularculaceae bacterium]